MTLEGVIEMHVHSSPDIRVRAVDDWGLVESAEKAGIRAVVIKNHFFPTMCRAADVQRASDKVKVFGGIALNLPSGGMNPDAVQRALQLGAKVVWLPTHDAENHFRFIGKPDGIGIHPGTKEAQALDEIIQMVMDKDAVLATGHISVEESKFVADRVAHFGLKKFVITHPENIVVNMSIEDQKQIATTGAFFERVFAQPEKPGSKVYMFNLDTNYKAMCELGFDSTVVSTDGGQIETPFWTDSLQRYMNYLADKGVPEEKINRMMKENPAYLLGLD